jgi:hypothetical protein
MSRYRGTRMQLSRYLRNFYDFVKEAVAGTIGGGGDSPQFPVEVANRYYPEKYQVPVRLQQSPLSWFPYLLEEKLGHAFDMSPLPLVLLGVFLVQKRPHRRQVPMTPAAFDTLFFGHIFLSVASRSSRSNCPGPSGVKARLD